MDLFNALNMGGSIYDRSLQSRILFLRQPITDEVANGVIAQFLYLDGTDSDTAIHLHIQSTGGSVAAGLAIYDVMQSLRSPIHTLCMGAADGISSLLLAIGTSGQRIAQPHARIRLAQPEATPMGNTIYDLDAASREVFRQRHILYELYAQATGQSIERIVEDTAQQAFLSATEAKNYGIIDQIN
jgi:ATP-dependent Clp protease, protease subunit